MSRIPVLTRVHKDGSWRTSRGERVDGTMGGRACWGFCMQRGRNVVMVAV